MAKDEIHKGDIGTVFRPQLLDGSTPVDISSASMRKITFKKPGGDTVTKNAPVNTDGTDGKMKYVTVAGDLDEAGDWELQAHVTIGTGTWHSDIYKFIVHDTHDVA